MAPSLRNTTNQERIARDLHRATGCGYQKALQRVKDAAAARLLPDRLDRAGREAAVRMLAEDHAPTVVAAPAERGGPRDKAPQLASVLLDVVRGGADKTVHKTDAPVPQNRTVLVDAGDLPESLEEYALTTHLAMGRLRGLRFKEETVAAMREERDRRWPLYLLPAVPRDAAEQAELLRQALEQR